MPPTRTVDILTIDVEGWELSVMAGFSLHRDRPKVVIMENLLGDQKYRAYMRERGYRIHLEMNPNDIFVAL